MARLTEQQLREIDEAIGDPKETVRQLREYRRDMEFLLSNEDRLLKDYPKQWIAIYDSEVKAAAESLQSLLVAMADLGLPKGNVVVQFMDTEQTKLIL
jgi:hypothetical protein